MENMKWEVIVDAEWFYEGSYDRALEVAESFWADPDFWGNCSLVSEEEFYGGRN